MTDALTAASVLDTLRHHAPTEGLCRDFMAILTRCRTRRLMITGPDKLDSRDDLLAQTLAHFMNHSQHPMTDGLCALSADPTDHGALYAVGASCVALTPPLELPGGVSVTVEPVVEADPLRFTPVGSEHLLVRVTCAPRQVTFAHTNQAALHGDLFSPLRVVDGAEDAFISTVEARGVMAGMTMFLRGIELSSEFLFAVERAAKVQPA